MKPATRVEKPRENQGCRDRDRRHTTLPGPFHSPRCILRRRPAGFVQGLEESNQSRGLSGIQTVPVCRHVAAALQNLADELVLREPRGYRVQRRTALAAAMIQRVAVVALLFLENSRSLAFQGRSTAQEFVWNRLAAPGVHLRAPGRVSGEAGERPQRDRDQ